MAIQPKETNGDELDTNQAMEGNTGRCGPYEGCIGTIGQCEQCTLHKVDKNAAFAQPQAKRISMQSHWSKEHIRMPPDHRMRQNNVAFQVRD